MDKVSVEILKEESIKIKEIYNKTTPINKLTKEESIDFENCDMSVDMNFMVTIK